MPRIIQSLAIVAILLGGGSAWGAEDPGAEEIGKIRVELIFGTDGDPAKAGALAADLQKAETDKLRASQQLQFTHYRKLGEDRKPVWRSFENWAVPMKPSEAIMVSFEPKGLEKNALMLDLKLWQRKREVLTALPLLRKGKKLYILGPAWRDGRLIIAVELLELKGK